MISFSLSQTGSVYFQIVDQCESKTAAKESVLPGTGDRVHDQPTESMVISTKLFSLLMFEVDQSNEQQYLRVNNATYYSQEQPVG